MQPPIGSLLASLCLCTGIFANSTAGAAQSMDNASVFANLKAEALLDNARVHVERFVVKPGQATGRHSHRDSQLLIYVRGGLLTGRHGRTTIWKEGRVQWFDGNDAVGDSSTNTGTTDIELVCVSLKPLPAAAAPPVHPVEALGYPNIPGEDLFENDFVIVQRFLVKPGQWEGVHAHQPNMLFVHIRGGQWGARSGNEAQHAYPHPSPDGEVGWMEPIDISAGHESGNIGSNPIDLVWVSLKK